MTDSTTELAFPSEWEKRLDVHVLDPDGWRRNNPFGPRDWTEPITRDEFIRRVSVSTITRLSPELVQEMSNLLDYRDAECPKCGAADNDCECRRLDWSD